MNLKSAMEIRNAVNERKLSANEVARASLARISEVDSRVNAFITIEAEKALERAQLLDARIAGGEGPLPLAGVPVAVKDNICTRGLRTTCGSKILQSYVPPFDATAVARIERAGGLVIGKTNCDEFAMGSSTENSSFQPTRNPYDLDRVPGGSSGGSAVAVGAGMVPLALGSETGGSVRQPASFCNVVGLKPTYGRISRYGLIAFASSLDCIGAFAHSLPDLALLLGIVSGQDDRDATSARDPVPDYGSELTETVRGLRVGIPEEFFGQGIDPKVRSVIEEGIRNVEKLGCAIEHISLPHYDYAVADYYIIAPAEASSNLARYDGVRYGFRSSDAATLSEMYRGTRSGGFGAEVKRRIMIGTYALSSGYYDAYYLRAMRVRTLIKQDYEEAFRKVDAILTPVSPTAAFKIGERVNDPLAMYLSDVYTVTANLVGFPALSVPCGFTDGLPVGLQIIGPHFEEATVLRLAHVFREAYPPPDIPLKI